MRVPWQHTVSTTLLLLSAVVVHLAGGVLPDYPLSDEDLEAAAGYYTEGGKYLGGIPQVGGDELSYDTCITYTLANGTTQETATEGSTCSEWTTGAPAAGLVGEDGDEMDRCSCEELTKNYCKTWHCSRVSVDTSSGCSVADSSNGRRTRRRMQQCYTEIAAATTRGRCDTEDADESEEFCANWSYEIYLNDQQTDAVFECVTPAASGLYCEAWTGTVESPDEVAAVACECTDESSDDTGLCASSQCTTKSIDKCSMCSLAISIAAFGIAGLLGIMMLLSRIFVGPRNSFCTYFSILWICAAATGVGLWGGQDGGMYTAILWIVGIASYMFCCRPPADDAANKPIQHVQSVNR